MKKQLRRLGLFLWQFLIEGTLAWANTMVGLIVEGPAWWPFESVLAGQKKDEKTDQPIDRVS